MPSDLELQKNAMWQLIADKQYEKAVRAASELLVESFAMDAIHIIGLGLSLLKQPEQGCKWLQTSLSLIEVKQEWVCNAVIALLTNKNFVEALQIIDIGISAFPDDISLLWMRAQTMAHIQEWDTAIIALDATLKLDPQFYPAIVAKAYAYDMTERFDAAIDLYRSLDNIVIAEPAREEITNSHACVLIAAGRSNEALELLDRAYPNSELPLTRYNRGMLYIETGRWPEAWHLYQSRMIVKPDYIPAIALPIAHSLEDIEGKHLCLFHEQGLGDSLMFLRFAALIRPHVSKLTIGVPKHMRNLTEHLIVDGSFNLITAYGSADIAGCEIGLPMLSCPALFDTIQDTLPIAPYFHIPPAIIERHRLPVTHKPRIGLIWAGGAHPGDSIVSSTDRRRSIPFKQMHPILALHDQFDFISLQLSDHHVADERISQPLISQDLLETAAVVMQLDLLITIDSAIAHLAGALGRPVWLLARFDQCWRYQRTGTVWYPATKVYQQEAHYMWADVIARVVADLKAKR